MIWRSTAGEHGCSQDRTSETEPAQDAVVYLDAAGRERFLVVGSPDAAGAPIAPALRRFLSAQGHADLSHPEASTWTAAEALSPIAWLTGRQAHPPAS
jgi:hypothetical protein